MTWDGGAAADPRFDTAWSGTPPGCPGVAERALEAAGGGGTLLLDCSETTLMRLRLPAGYETVSVTTMEDVLSRSRELGRRVWREKPMR